MSPAIGGKYGMYGFEACMTKISYQLGALNSAKWDMQLHIYIYICNKNIFPEHARAIFDDWLVVWNMTFIFPYWEFHHPN